jgi:hypothetical protein
MSELTLEGRESAPVEEGRLGKGDGVEGYGRVVEVVAWFGGLG